MHRTLNLRFSSRVLAYLVVVHLAATPGQAQGFITLTETQFDLEAGGARSLALGGAFTAVADDLTAAIANPAGLLDLDGAEARLEIRYAELEQNSPGSFAPDSFSSSVFDPSFVGFGRSRERFAFGVYASRQRVETHYLASSSFDVTIGPPTSTLTTSDFDLELRTVAAALALRLGPRVSVGGALRHLSMDLDSLATSISRTGDFLVETIETIDDGDSAVLIDLGLMIRPSERWSIGLAWRGGERFDLEQTRDFSVGGLPSSEVSAGEIAVPEILALGVAVQPTPSVLITAEVSQVATGDWSRQGSLLVGDDVVDDVTRVHVGARFAHGNSERRLIWSLGLQSDPDHDGQFTKDAEQWIASAGFGLELQRGLRFDLAVAAGEFVLESIAGLGYRW